MNICVFWWSDGVGSATSRKTRGLTRSVIALMVPPLPAASRPSNTTITRRPVRTTHCWSLHNSIWSFCNSFSYFLRFILDSLATGRCLDMGHSQQYLVSQAVSQSTGQGVAFQIPAAYSAMVRSLENFPEQATLRMALRAHASGLA